MHHPCSGGLKRQRSVLVDPGSRVKLGSPGVLSRRRHACTRQMQSAGHLARIARRHRHSFLSMRLLMELNSGFPTMFELKQAGFAAIAPLFSELYLRHGSVRAVLRDPSLGHVWVDDLASPSQAVLRGPEGVYLAGHPPHDLGSLAGAIVDWDYVYPDESWLRVIRDVLPNRFMIAHDRVRLTLNSNNARSFVVPSSFELVAASQSLDVSIIHADEIVSRCSVDMNIDGYVEFGVWTHPAYRGNGLAKIAASACVNRVTEQGITTFAWHCHASNTRSQKVAMALGFEVTDRYQAFSASVPAENDGDLDIRYCRELATDFETGASEILWLDFHAAVAWTLADEHSKAVVAVERLVERGWTGKAEWLEEHWALERLNVYPRFQSAVKARRTAS